MVYICDRCTFPIEKDADISRHVVDKDFCAWHEKCDFGPEDQPDFDPKETEWLQSRRVN